MISKRSFFTISVVMLIVLVLFQFTQFAKYEGNNYTFNELEKLKMPVKHEWQQEKCNLTAGNKFSFKDSDYILFIGDENTAVGSIVSQWTLYSKRNICICDSISQFDLSGNAAPEFLIVDSNFTDLVAELDFYRSMIDKGVSIVFCTLPGLEVIKSDDEVREFLGITHIEQDEVTVEGYKLFSGFLLGGETVYQPKKASEERRQDMDLTIPWYVTGGGTKTYMVGLLDDYFGDYDNKNEFFPAIIWRKSYGSGQVFCIAGDYMSTTSGLGLLSAMINELSEYQVYPIVNAQNTLLVDFPILANENEEEFKKIYSRDIAAFQSDVIWPMLVSLAEKYDLKYTAFVSPKYDYSDPALPDADMYNQYLMYFNERDTEAGISLEHAPGISLVDKLAYDEEFFDSLEEKYTSTSAFLNMEDYESLNEAIQMPCVEKVRTVACAEDVMIPILSYIDDDITLQSLTSDTENLTYTKDLRLKSIETALGFDNAKMIFSEVFNPKSEEDEWQIVYVNMSSALTTYWAPFRVFDRTTLAESDQRVRVFLNLDYEVSRKNDEIKIKVDGRDDNTCYFMLRTHGEEIDEMKGGTYEKIEDNAYILTIDSDEVKLHLVDTNTFK